MAGGQCGPPVRGADRDDDREVIAARYFLELSEAETAAAAGIS